MKYYTDKQNYILNNLEYTDIDRPQSWEPGMKLVDLVSAPCKIQLKGAGLDHLEIVDYANNNDSDSPSGFRAIAFGDPKTGERGMVFRSTEVQGANQVDMINNVHTTLSSESVQKQASLTFFERNKSPYGDNYLYGHSNGSELTAQVYVENYDEIRQVHIINPRPINLSKLNQGQRDAMKSDKVDVVIIDSDAVYSLEQLPFSGENTRIIKTNGSQDSLLGSHALESGILDGDYYKIEATPVATCLGRESFHETDKQNYVLNNLAYANIDASKTWEPGMKLVELVEEPYKTQLKEAGLDHLEIVDYTNNNDSGSHSGFCAIAFRDPETGERGISFRGTEELDKITEGANQVDMMDNIHTALSGESVQKQEALEFFERNKSLYGDNYLYGHSKGGELASEVYAENYDEIRQMHIINPQPINPSQLSKKQREAMKSDKVDVVIIDGDTVHSLGEWPFSDENTRIIKNNGSQDGFFGPHSLEAGMPEGDYYEIEENPFANYPDQAAFCGAVKPIITAAQKGYLPKNYVFFYTLASIYTFVVRDIPAAIESFKEAMVSVVKTIIKVKEKIEGFITAFNDFVQVVVSKLKNWWYARFDRGFKYSSANPQIRVDTYKLKDYAQRLWRINGRIALLDGRLDSLYWRVGLLDLWKLMQADMLTGYSWRLNRCASYLNETATDFENVEFSLVNNL